jgi:hypothetical protein
LALAVAAFLVIDANKLPGSEKTNQTRTSTAVQRSAARGSTQRFDVVIAGGSLAAFIAAVASAESGARTALIEPTDWVGGQLTASGVPAIDEAWHTIRDPKSDRDVFRVFEAARDPANVTPSFLRLLQAIENPGECWVSRYCFRPDVFLEKQLRPLQQRVADRLFVFHNTVVKRVEVDGGGRRIRSLLAISRVPKPGIACGGYDRHLSQQLPDWYSPTPSERYDKRIVKFVADSPRRGTVFIDATEWGEILALSRAPYLQGVEDADGALTGNDACGQATVFCFVQELRDEPIAERITSQNVSNLGFGQYRDRPDAWEKIWTYRRIRGQGKPAAGDLCLQNWGYSLAHQEGGNDYPFGYLFKSRDATATEREDWCGGVNLNVMAEAERRALAWHEWFKAHTPPSIGSGNVALARNILGTGHGLAKMPYIRDTRRSIGLNGFVLRFADLTGPLTARTGKAFEDRVALGAYPVDVHGLTSCQLPEYARNPGETLPFFIPFRALTNDRFENLLVAGKTMAQSFLANSATRLHPIEWSTGTAAGVAAAYMAETGKTSLEAYRSVHEIQRILRCQTPLEWTIESKIYPAAAERRDSVLR